MISTPCGCQVVDDGTMVLCRQHREGSVPPLYWMHEVSGKARGFVKRFFDGGDLKPIEISFLKWYLWQWVRAMPRPPDGWEPRILAVKDRDGLEDATNWLLHYAIDPW